MLLGAALQLTNMYGDSFLSGFETNPVYKDSLVVKYSVFGLFIFYNPAFVASNTPFIKSIVPSSFGIIYSSKALI
jgi:NHS family xanthosine MFS transporter